MKLHDFLSQVPDIINHETAGYGELEIVANSKNKKGVCYRHKNNSSSYGTYGKSWEEIYNDLMPFLKSKKLA